MHGSNPKNVLYTKAPPQQNLNCCCCSVAADTKQQAVTVTTSWSFEIVTHDQSITLAFSPVAWQHTVCPSGEWPLLHSSSQMQSQAERPSLAAPQAFEVWHTHVCCSLSASPETPPELPPACGPRSQSSRNNTFRTPCSAALDATHPRCSQPAQLAYDSMGMWCNAHGATWGPAVWTWLWKFGAGRPCCLPNRAAPCQYACRMASATNTLMIAQWQTSDGCAHHTYRWYCSVVNNVFVQTQHACWGAQYACKSYVCVTKNSLMCHVTHTHILHVLVHVSRTKLWVQNRVM